MELHIPEFIPLEVYVGWWPGNETGWLPRNEAGWWSGNETLLCNFLETFCNFCLTSQAVPRVLFQQWRWAGANNSWLGWTCLSVWQKDSTSKSILLSWGPGRGEERGRKDGGQGRAIYCSRATPKQLVCLDVRYDQKEHKPPAILLIGIEAIVGKKFCEILPNLRIFFPLHNISSPLLSGQVQEKVKEQIKEQEVTYMCHFVSDVNLI